MPRPRKENPELEKMVRDRRKKFVRSEEGAQIYSMGFNTFKQLAKDYERLVCEIERDI